MNLSEPVIRRPVMTAVLTASVVLFGILAYRQLPVNDLPVVDYPVIQVQADYPGASPDTMANNIATPLERQFMQITGLEVVTSKSTQGHVSLTLQFSLDKSIDRSEERRVGKECRYRRSQYDQKKKHSKREVKQTS